MKQYSLRHHRHIAVSEISQLNQTFHFQLKPSSIQVGKNKVQCLYVDKVNSNEKGRYQLKSINGIHSYQESNCHRILYDSIVTRECIEVGDVLYAFVSNDNGVFTFGEFIQDMDDLYSCTMNNLNLSFVFVSFTLYQLLVQKEDYKETVEKVKPSKYRVVRQEWDYENRCLHCNFMYLKSQKEKFRSKCCANGRFMKQELPQDLQFYCRFENNEILLRNFLIYNNLLAFGSLGVDKQYDSIYTQGGSVTLQGRTYLQHKRPGNDTNGQKNDDDDRRFTTSC